MAKKRQSEEKGSKKRGVSSSQAFGRGYDDARRMKEENKSNFDKLFWLNIQGKEGEDTDQQMIFLHDEPLDIYAHGLTGLSGSGKSFFQNFLCTRADGECICCDMGAKRRQLGLFLVIEPGTGNNSDRVKIFPVSSRALPNLERKAKKSGIANCLMTVTRNGKSAQTTTYDFEKEEELEGDDYYDVEAVIEILPEAMGEILQEIYEDNDEDSDEFNEIYIEFLKRCLFADLEDLEENPENYELSRYDRKDSDDEEEESPRRKKGKESGGTKRRRAIVDYDEDEDSDDDEDDEEDSYVPSRKGKKSSGKRR